MSTVRTTNNNRIAYCSAASSDGCITPSAARRPVPPRPEGTDEGTCTAKSGFEGAVAPGRAHLGTLPEPAQDAAAPIPSRRHATRFVCVLALSMGSHAFGATHGSVLTRTQEAVLGDYRNFYSSESLFGLGIAFGAGAVMANTAIDKDVRNAYQNHLRSGDTDNLSDVFKTLGEGAFVIPISVGAAVLGEWLPAEGSVSAVGLWGRRTARAFLVGGPATLLMQNVTGGSRPGESNHDSSWRPFQDNNGVSGHAFVGAVPFLTLAGMTDNPLLRAGAYAASSLSGLSRINDDAHYASQVLLGWYMAYAATAAVSRSDVNHAHITLLPLYDGAIAEWHVAW